MAPTVYNSNNQAAATLVRVAENEVSRLLGSLEVARQKVADKKIKLEAKYGRNIPIRELKKLDSTLYRELQRNGKAFKSLRRGLGSLITTMPEFLGDNGVLGKLEEVINKGPGGFKDEGAYINKIKNVLDNWDTKRAFYKEGINEWTNEAMTVGHHEISLSTLRDELSDLGKTQKGFKLRKAILNLAKKRGFRIGEEFVKHIDPVAHKFEKTLKGRLLKLFPKGTDFNDPKFDTLFRQLSDRYSHAYWGGSTTGIDIPVGTIPRGGTPEQGLDLIKGALVIQEAATESGVNIHKLLNTMLGDLKKGQLPKDPDQLLVTLSNKLSELPIPDVEPEWKDLVDKGIVSKNRFRDIQTNIKGLRLNPRNILTRKVLFDAFTKIPKAGARPVAEIVDAAYPGKPAVDAWRSGNIGEGFSLYGKQLKDTGTILGLTGAGMFAASRIPLVAKGLGIAGGLGTGPGGWALLAGSLASTTDDVIFDGAGKRAIYEQKENLYEFGKAAHEGELLTNPEKRKEYITSPGAAFPLKGV